MYVGPYGTEVVPKMFEYLRDLHGLWEATLNILCLWDLFKVPLIIKDTKP